MNEMKRKLSGRTALYVLQALAQDARTNNNPTTFDASVSVREAPLNVKYMVMSAEKDGHDRIKIDAQILYGGCSAIEIEQSRESVKCALKAQMSETLGLDEDMLDINPLFLDSSLLLNHGKPCRACGRPTQEPMEAS